MKESGRGLLTVISRYLPGETEKTMKNIRHHTRFQGRDLNSGTSENETGVMTIQPRRSVRRKTVVTLNVDDVQLYLGGLQVRTNLY
jgi:hypothetical protein